MWLGTYQLGRPVPLAAQSRVSLTGSLPSSTPVARIYTAAGSLVETVSLPLVESSEYLFGRAHRLSGSYSVGRHLVLYRWTISGTTYQEQSHFDVVAGGDGDGAVTFLGFHQNAQGPNVLYGTETGKVIQGRSPSVEGAY